MLGLSFFHVQRSGDQMPRRTSDRPRSRLGPAACWPAAVLGCLSLLASARADQPAGQAQAADDGTGGDRARPAAVKPVHFAQEVFPILQSACFECHGPQKQMAELRLDARTAAFKGSKSGVVIVPGKSQESLLFRRVSSGDLDDRMPPKGDGLTTEQLSRIRAWIDQGAVWPDGVGSEGGEVKKHWAYEQPVRRDPPPVRNTKWVRNPIDSFVLARLEREKLAPSRAAPRTTLIRRLSLDLIGLPPTLPEVEAFLADRRPDAYERLVERLLASPHYGERWARPWLDMARYADTNGYEADQRRSNWLYRDWVIQALNQDLPFDQFTIEQLAGDLLPDATIAQKIATGFHRNTMTNTEGGTDDEEFRVAAVIDRVNTTFEVWMGTTFGCCQCHNHKYDPFTQKEYYQVFAFFNQTKDGGRETKPMLEAPTPEQAAKRAELKAKIDPLQRTLDTQTPELDVLQRRWEAQAQAHRERLGRAWTDLELAHLEASGGVTLERLPDNSILAGGPTPETSVYEITGLTPAGPITAVRLETLVDERLPQGASGRSENGNFVLSDLTVEARPLQEPKPTAGEPPAFGLWHKIGPFKAGSMDEAFKKEFPPEKEIDLAKPDEDGGLRWTEQPEFTDGQTHQLTGENAATYLYRTITAAQAMPLMVSLGSDDGLQVWLNGEKLLARNVARGVEPDQELVRLDLKAGENRLLLKVNNGSGGYGFYFAISKDQSGIYRVNFAQAYSDVAEPKYEVDRALDGDPKTGWTIGSLDATNRANHAATFLSRQPVDLPGGARWVFRLKQESPDKQHLLGRFRLSVSMAPLEAHAGWGKLPPATRALLEVPPDQRTTKQKEELAAYHRSIEPSLDQVREQVAELRKQEPKDVPTTLVMEEVEKPRPTHVFKRGSFLNKGEEVTPGVPAVLHPLPAGQPLNRLTFARWLADPANPLVGRVTMNRLWAQYFGRGLVETSEEFGAQGEPPAHPELLDWLATEFVRQGWRLKAMHRLIVTSATYRQAATVTPVLAQRDPDNRLLARGPRLRLEAELLRDNALAISGLLNPKIGGPSVFPSQPDGVWSNPYSEDKWVTSKEGDQFRRGLYTFWRRTAPYASFMAFDAPSREVCCERRPRTNTPLQALVTLNDPAFIAPAAALARRVLAEGGATDRQRLAYAFRRCLARPPTAAETRHLLSLYREACRRLSADPARAEALAAGGLDKPEGGADLVRLAAWTVVANVLLNLDETLTKG
jgi:hypothetical protein